MATQRTQFLALSSYAAGTYPFGPVALRVGDTSAYIEVSRCTSAQPTWWPSTGVSVELRLELSRDAGVSWSPWGAFVASGGVGFADVAQSVPVALTTLEVPLSSGASRQIRGTVLIKGGALFSQASVELRGG